MSFNPNIDGQIATMTPAQIKQFEHAMQSGWKLTPATLASKITRGRWIPARHLKYISTIVATEIAKGNARIIVCMPARHGKSEFLSVNTPIWFLEHWPHKQVMNLSYGLELASEFSLKVRSTFLDEENHSLLTTRLRRDKLKIDRFLTTQGGGVTAAGIGGVITGRGADLLLVDDYVKNAEQALSETQNENTMEWFKSTAYTRLEPNASIIVLATRWGIRDLIGRLLTEMSHENWIVITLPALAVANDPLGRAIGEPLWPERYPLARLEAIKKSIGGYWWDALFQQDPRSSMAGADLGDKLRIIPENELPPLHLMRCVRAWDLAAQDKAGDYTAGPKVYYYPENGRFYIVDMQRLQSTPLGVQNRVETMAEADGPGVPIWLEQEPGSSGVIVIDHYRRSVLKGYTVGGDKPSGRLEVRANPMMADIEAGLVFMVEAPWNQALIDEFNAFPSGVNDDQISALALAHHKLNASKFGSIIWGREATDEHAKLVRAKASYENAPNARSARSIVWGR